MKVDKKAHVDFRSYLQAELLRRTQANPRYSLRAFALFLGVQSGFLSKILLNQRRVTANTIEKFGTRLGLSPKDIFYFQKISQSTREVSSPRQFHPVSQDHFEIISSWYHFAILELAATDNFNPKPQWIAKKLGLSLIEVKDAIARLIRLKYIEVHSDEQWTLTEGDSSTLNLAATNSALRKMQVQILNQALEALEVTPIDFRDQSTMTVAVDSDLIAPAKEKIKKFRRELAKFLESGSKKDAVYQLSISLFPVTDRNDRSDL